VIPKIVIGIVAACITVLFVLMVRVEVDKIDKKRYDTSRTTPELLIMTTPIVPGCLYSSMGVGYTMGPGNGRDMAMER
jgi:hypothetical protein